MELLSNETILIFVLILTRISGMFISAPLFSSAQIPQMIKVIMCVTISIVMFPIIFKNTTSVPTDLIMFSLAAVKELAAGLLIGFAALIIFTSIQLAGEYVSHLMGLSIANVVDPVTQMHIPVLGQFYYILALLTFLFIDGHHWLIAAVQTSYFAVPIGFDFPNVSTVLQKIVLLSSQMYLIALMLVAPILGVLFVTEVALGFMAKIMPRMNIFVVGLPLKIYVGLTLVITVMPMTKVFIDNVFRTLFFNLYKLMV